jgi:hypothetical protein
MTPSQVRQRRQLVVSRSAGEDPLGPQSEDASRTLRCFALSWQEVNVCSCFAFSGALLLFASDCG